MSVRFIDSMFDRTFRGVQKSLDLTFRRNEAITSNIANAETPGYRAIDVNFASELERAFAEDDKQIGDMKKTDARHLDITSDGGAHIMPDLSGAMRGDGNNVDIDLQMGRLATNGGQFSLATQLIKKKFSVLKTAIREGSR